MLPWLFSVHINCLVREVNVRMLGRGLKQVGMNGETAVCLPMSLYLFADDTALVAVLEEKL